MIVKVEATFDAESVLQQMEKVQRLSRELTNETFKLDSMLSDSMKVKEKGDSEESPMQD